MAPLLDASIIDGLKRVAPPASASPTLPPAVYVDPAVALAERELLFRRGWVGCGRSDRWQEPGSCAAIEIAGAPVLVTRDASGMLRAFANTCRHRGTRLVDRACRASRIVCPFHAWTYALDGRLTGAPRMAADFDRAAHGLHPYLVEERAGFIFVSLADDAAPIDDWLAGFGAVHAPWPLERLVTTRRVERGVPCNWKLFLEVFNEYYHLGCVHRSTFGAIYHEPDPVDAVAGCFTTQFGTNSGTGGLKESDQRHALPAMPGLEGRHLDGTRYTWIYPNMTFAAGRDAAWVLEAQPDGPSACRVALSVCFPRETLEHGGFAAAAGHYYARMDEALEEDIAVLEEQQAGMASPHAAPGRFAALEPSVAGFAFWYAAMMAA